MKGKIYFIFPVLDGAISIFKKKNSSKIIIKRLQNIIVVKKKNTIFRKKIIGLNMK